MWRVVTHIRLQWASKSFSKAKASAVRADPTLERKEESFMVGAVAEHVKVHPIPASKDDSCQAPSTKQFGKRKLSPAIRGVGEEARFGTGWRASSHPFAARTAFAIQFWTEMDLSSKK